MYLSKWLERVLASGKMGGEDQDDQEGELMSEQELDLELDLPDQVGRQEEEISQHWAVKAATSIALLFKVRSGDTRDNTQTFVTFRSAPSHSPSCQCWLSPTLASWYPGVSPSGCPGYSPTSTSFGSVQHTSCLWGSENVNLTGWCGGSLLPSSTSSPSPSSSLVTPSSLSPWLIRRKPTTRESSWHSV